MGGKYHIVGSYLRRRDPIGRKERIRMGDLHVQSEQDLRWPLDEDCG